MRAGGLGLAGEGDRPVRGRMADPDADRQVAGRREHAPDDHAALVVGQLGRLAEDAQDGHAVDAAAGHEPGQRRQARLVERAVVEERRRDDVPDALQALDGRSSGPPVIGRPIRGSCPGRSRQDDQAQPGDPQARAVGEDLGRRVELECAVDGSWTTRKANAEPAGDRQDRERQPAIQPEWSVAVAYGRATRARVAMPTRNTRMPLPSKPLPERR